MRSYPLNLTWVSQALCLRGRWRMRVRVRVRERGQKGFHPSSVADSSPSRAQVIPAERSAMSQASGTSPARALARAPVVDSSGKERSLHHEPGAVVLRKTPSELFTTMRLGAMSANTGVHGYHRECPARSGRLAVSSKHFWPHSLSSLKLPLFDASAPSFDACRPRRRGPPVCERNSVH